MQTERRVAANPQTKPTDLGCESADRLLSSADTIAILLLLSSIQYKFIYMAAISWIKKLILILPSHGGWKAEST